MGGLGFFRNMRPKANDTNFHYEKGKGFKLELEALLECTSMRDLVKRLNKGETKAYYEKDIQKILTKWMKSNIFSKVDTAYRGFSENVIKILGGKHPESTALVFCFLRFGKYDLRNFNISFFKKALVEIMSCDDDGHLPYKKSLWDNVLRIKRLNDIDRGIAHQRASVKNDKKLRQEIENSPKSNEMQNFKKFWFETSDLVDKNFRDRFSRACIDGWHIEKVAEALFYDLNSARRFEKLDVEHIDQNTNVLNSLKNGWVEKNKQKVAIERYIKLDVCLSLIDRNKLVYDYKEECMNAKLKEVISKPPYDSLKSLAMKYGSPLIKRIYTSDEYEKLKIGDDGIVCDNTHKENKNDVAKENKNDVAKEFEKMSDEYLAKATFGSKVPTVGAVKKRKSNLDEIVDDLKAKDWFKRIPKDGMEAIKEYLIRKIKEIQK